MWIYPQSDTTYGHTWRIVKADSPYVVGTRIHPAGLQIRTPPGSRLYFFVPANVRKFDLIVNGWGGFDVLDPAGKVLTTEKGVRGGYKSIPVRRADGKMLESGLYQLQVKQILSGRIRFSSELPGFFVIDPEHALQVTLDEKKLLEQQKKQRF